MKQLLRWMPLILIPCLIACGNPQKQSTSQASIDKANEDASNMMLFSKSLKENCQLDLASAESADSKVVSKKIKSLTDDQVVIAKIFLDGYLESGDRMSKFIDTHKGVYLQNRDKFETQMKNARVVRGMINRRLAGEGAVSPKKKSRQTASQNN